MKTREEKFFSLSESSKESILNLARRRQWNCSVKKIRKNCYDVVLHVPEDFPKIGE